MTWTVFWLLGTVLAADPAPDVEPAPLAGADQATPVIPFQPSRPDGQPYTCTAGGVVDVGSGQILYGRKLTERRFPASCTKIVTTLLALEAIERGEAALTDQVVISPTAAAVPESGIWLQVGERMSLRDLLVGVMVRSANDASHGVAEYLGGGDAQLFVDRMNARMAELGAVQSHFLNPHGLHQGLKGEPTGDQHYSCGYDLLLATLTAWRFPFFRELCVMDREPISWENLSTKPEEQHNGQRIIGNRNRLLDRYDACIGVKTGYTKQAGACLVSAAYQPGRVVLAVTLQSASGEDRWQESEGLLRFGLEQFAAVTVLTAGEELTRVKVARGDPPTVAGRVTEGVEAFCHVGYPKPYLVVSAVPELAAPVLAGTPVGEVIAHLPDGATRRVALVAGESSPLSADARWRLQYGPGVLALLVGLLTYAAAAETHRRRRPV